MNTVLQMSRENRFFHLKFVFRNIIIINQHYYDQIGNFLQYLQKKNNIDLHNKKLSTENTKKKKKKQLYSYCFFNLKSN